MAKAVELLRSTNKSILNNLAIYIYKSFQIRNEVMLNRDIYYNKFYQLKSANKPYIGNILTPFKKFILSMIFLKAEILAGNIYFNIFSHLCNIV